MSELLLISLDGDDKPGITTAIMELLGQQGVDLLDVGQSVIHSHLSLGILAKLPAGSEQLIEQLQACAEQLGVSIACSPVSLGSYDDWVGLQGRGHFILTLLARRIRAAHLAAVSRVVADSGLNIDNITRLSGRVPLQETGEASKACVEFTLRGEPASHFRERLVSVAQQLGIDVAVQEDGIFRRNRRLIAFDMDSTLIATEVIDELAALAGVGDKVAAITGRAMAGDLDFKASLEQRVALLAGLKEQALAQVAARLPLQEGAESLFRTLNQLGYKTAIITGGFDYFGRQLQARLGADYLHANRLEIHQGQLTGRLLPPIIDAQGKAKALRELAAKEKIALAQTIAVGDGANDLAMLDLAGLGIAFHAKPLVRDSAEHAISNLGLDSILYLMGFRDRDAEQL